jgi:cysteine desulfurase
MDPRIYVDHAATTPLLPEVRAAMEPWLGSEFGNPSSLNSEGRKAKDAIDQAREVLSEELGALFAEVIFTSSGTESANMAIIGAALANQDPKRTRVLMGAAEHHCVLNTEFLLKRLGYTVHHVPVNREAVIDLRALEGLLGSDVLLVSAMHANNELGTLQPVEEVARLAHGVGALYHCDAVQTFMCGLPRWTVDDIGADLLTLAAHKLNGPKGAGLTYIRAGTSVKPLIAGGGQEREMRAGTEDVATIVGFAKAVLQHRILDHSPKQKARDAFKQRLTELNPNGLQWSVQGAPSLAGHAHFRIAGTVAESMLISLDRAGISASSGASCSSGSLEPSHVLLACGYSPEEAKQGLRFTFGHTNTVEEGTRAAETVADIASRMGSA